MEEGSDSFLIATRFLKHGTWIIGGTNKSLWFCLDLTLNKLATMGTVAFDPRPKTFHGRGRPCLARVNIRQWLLSTCMRHYTYVCRVFAIQTDISVAVSQTHSTRMGIVA